MLFVEVLMSPSNSEVSPPLPNLTCFNWAGSLALHRPEILHAEEPNESSQCTQTKDKQETLASLEPVIVFNMSINHCISLESLLFMKAKVNIRSPE